MRRLAKIAEILLILALAANAVALAYYFWLRPRAGLYEVGQHFPLPDGYSPSGGRLASAPRGCYLLRLTAIGCEYCRRDQPEFTKLAAAARSAGCEVLEAAPKPEWQVPAKSGVVQLEYIGMPLGRVLVPYLTPQTLLVAPDAKLVWYRVGAMDQRTLRTALEDTRKLSEAR